MAKILIVDDEPRIRELIGSIYNMQAMSARKRATALPPFRC